ncbi:MAG: nickel transporter [Candidatus Krumholzibacteria bacterium]|nr:nickel transporter [Candidatus Krumholzibacteria bacterium]
MFLPLITGILAGFVHVLVGPDHLAAVGTLVADQRRRPWKVGFFWGVGHTYGVWLIAILVLLFKAVIPIEKLTGVSEILVGITLITIGLWSLRKALVHRIHYHEHTHGGDSHAHFHIHKSVDEQHQRATHDHTHAATGVGLLHGLAGSSHLLAVLPTAALPGWTAVAYILGYGLGSVAAMSGFSWVMGRLMSRWIAAYSNTYSIILGSFALAAMGLGILWLVHV